MLAAAPDATYGYPNAAAMMLQNLIETSIEAFGITNFFVFALSEGMCDAVRGQPCYYHRNNLRAGEYGTAEFARLVNIKTEVLVASVRLGYARVATCISRLRGQIVVVWLSECECDRYNSLLIDGDIVFLRDPRPELTVRTDLVIQVRCCTSAAGAAWRRGLACAAAATMGVPELCVSGGDGGCTTVPARRTTKRAGGIRGSCLCAQRHGASRSSAGGGAAPRAHCAAASGCRAACALCRCLPAAARKNCTVCIRDCQCAHLQCIGRLRSRRTRACDSSLQ